jgi:hypothetical protein
MRSKILKQCVPQRGAADRISRGRFYLAPEALMKFVLQPRQLMLIILANWINREQQSRIKYWQSEVAVRKEQGLFCQHSGGSRASTRRCQQPDATFDCFRADACMIIRGSIL